MSETDREPTPANAEQIQLTSWKEIAARLQVSPKTAQRYETELGLPIKRLNGRVSIALSDLLAWQTRNSKATPWWANVRNLQLGLAATGGLALLAVLAFGAYLFLQRTGPPASVHLDGSLLVVRDKEDRPVWQHRFDTPTFHLQPNSQIRFDLADLDRDGQVETVGVWPHVQRDTKGWDVHCFSAAGKLLWQLSVQDKVRTASGKEFGPPYVVRDFTLFDSPENDGTQWLAAVFVNVADVPSTLVVVDSQGKRRGQYWHSGHLSGVRMFDADGDGKNEIVAGGVRHGAEQAVLVAFDPARVAGANPMPANHPRTILEKGASSEKWTGFIARTNFSEQLGSFNFISMLHLGNGNLHAHVIEAVRAPEGYLVYEFKPGLRIQDITLSVALMDATRQSEIKSKLGELIPEKELARLRQDFRLEPPR